MKALSKDQVKEKAVLITDIMAAHDELETAINSYNAVMATEQAKVQEQLDVLNSKIQGAKEWTESLSSDMQSYFDEKSEKWQEGEDGQSYLSWQEDYDNFDPDDVDLDLPEDIEVPDCDVANDIENLPDEP